MENKYMNINKSKDKKTSANTNHENFHIDEILKELGEYPLKKYPNRKNIIKSINLFKSILFPGFFGLSEINPLNINHHLAILIENACELIQGEILKGLCFACPKEKQLCQECFKRSKTMAQQLINNLPKIKTILMSDIEASYLGDPAAVSKDEVLFSYPGIQAMIHHRIAHQLFKENVPILPRIISELAHGQTGIDIHPGAKIEESFFIDHGTGVVIGETAEIGKNVRIYQGVTLGAKSFPLDANGNPIKGIPRHPIIEDNVVIYAGATILGRITIGKGSVIGGNVWLTNSVAPGQTVIN
ncbi:MAG: serine acetyltransferase [Oligoflexia bacterium]|nr:serine acetyltransferase [Oligoflexia bacterium]